MLKPVVTLMNLCGIYRTRLWLGAALHAIAGLLHVAPALVAAKVLIDAADGTLTDASWRWALAIVGLALIGRLLLAYIANRIIWVDAYRATGLLRHRILDRIRADPVNELGYQTAGESLSVLTYDAGKIAGFLSWQMPGMLSSIVSSIVIIIVLFILSPLLAAVAVAVGLVSVPVLRYGIKQIHAVYVARREANADANEHLSEHVRGIDVIRSLNAADRREGALTKALDSIRDLDTASVNKLTPAYTTFQTLIDAGLAALVVVAALRHDGNAPWLIGALVLSTAFFRPQLEFGAAMIHMPELFASVDKVDRWLQRPTPTPLPEATIIPAANGALGVRLAHLTVGYQPGVPVLNDVSIAIEAGTTLAIVGPSGSGKSTLLKTIAGMLTPTSGQVSIGRADLRTMPREQLADLVTAVFQDTTLTHATVADIISSGNPSMTYSEIERVARATHIHERIMAMPDGYQSLVGEDGRGLSGGERQRLAIARAMAKPAPVLLLDEATSALDATNELKLRTAVTELAAGRTVVVVAHRLESIRTADRIVFLDDGRISETGTHAELLAAGGPYARFWELRTRAAGWSLAAP